MANMDCLSICSYCCCSCGGGGCSVCNYSSGCVCNYCCRSTDVTVYLFTWLCFCVHVFVYICVCQCTFAVCVCGGEGGPGGGGSLWGNCASWLVYEDIIYYEDIVMRILLYSLWGYFWRGMFLICLLMCLSWYPFSVSSLSLFFSFACFLSLGFSSKTLTLPRNMQLFLHQSKCYTICFKRKQKPSLI